MSLPDSHSESPEGVLWLNAEGQLAFCSQDLCLALGYSEPELKALPLYDLIPELTNERFGILWNQVLEEGSAQLQCHTIDNTGRYYPIDIRFGHIRDNGDILLSAFIQHLAPRTEAERLLLLVAQTTVNSTEKGFFRALARSVAEALNVHGALITECMDFPTTRVRTLALWTNNTFTGNIEYDLADTPCDKVIKEGQVCLYSNRLSERFPKDKGVESYLGLPIFDANNSRVIGHMAFFDSQELPKSFYHKAAFDIFCARASAELERMQTTRELRQQEQKYRLLVENQQELVAQLDARGCFVFASPSLCELFGRRELTMLGTAFLDLVEEADQEVARQSWATLKGLPYRSDFEHRARTTNGWRWLSWSLKASMNEQDQIQSVVCVGRDVTERREAEENARQTLQELAHLSRVSSMGEMASAFAHEVNQPLCAILSYAQACLRLLGNDQVDTAELRHALERVAANAELAGNIIQQMRNFLRKGEPKFHPVDILQLLQEAVLLAKVELHDYSIGINLECEQPLPPVNVNATQIEQVILNYLRNARDAILAAGNQRGEVQIEAHRTAPRELQISICDSGPGISRDLMNRMFEPFVTSKAAGIGIGLSICKSIVESHGGRVTGFNHPNGGACFQLTLPLVDTEGG